MRKILLQSSIPTIIILVIGGLILNHNEFFTKYKSSTFNEVMTPIFTLVSSVMYFLTLIHLKNSNKIIEEQNIFISVKDRLENLRKTLKDKKFHSLSYSRDEKIKELCERTNILQFYDVYTYLLLRFHTFHIEQTKKDRNEFLPLLESKLYIKDKLPEELRMIMDYTRFVISEIEREFEIVDTTLKSIKQYQFNDYQNFELDSIVNDIYSNLDHTISHYTTKDSLGLPLTYILVYKDKEFKFDSKQIPNFYPGDSFKPILDDNYRIKSLLDNYKSYINRNKKLKKTFRI